MDLSVGGLNKLKNWKTSLNPMKRIQICVFLGVNLTQSQVAGLCLML